MVKKGNSLLKKLWKKPKVKWLVLVLGFIFLNIGLYRIDKWWEMKKAVTRQALFLNSPAPEITPTPAVPIGWSLYEHETLGVQIMHPLKVAVFDDELKFVLRSTEITQSKSRPSLPKFTIRVYW